MTDRDEYGGMELEAIAFGGDDVVLASPGDTTPPWSPEDE